MDDKKKQFIDGLNQLIEFISNGPDVPLPEYLRFDVWLHSDDAKKQLSDVARIAGRVEKCAIGDFYYLRKTFNERITLEWNVDRKEVCERIVEKKVVPERVIPAQPEQVIPEHEEEIVTWKCPESLLAEQVGV